MPSAAPEEPSYPAEPPARLWQAPVNPKSKQEQEDGLFNSIVEAVGMMDQLPAEPEQPEQPAPKRPERVDPPSRRPEPRDSFQRNRNSAMNCPEKRERAKKQSLLWAASWAFCC